LAALRVTFSSGAGGTGTSMTMSIDRLDDDRLRIVGGVAISGSQAALASGGHLLVPLAGRAGSTSDLVEIDCAFRAMPLDGRDAARLLRRSPLERVQLHTRRLAGAAGRRLEARRSRGARS
jgi:hypothetical protein